MRRAVGGKGNSITIEHVTKKFELEAENLEVLQDINLEIQAGEFISIVGASGCGKSTLLKMISGLDQATDGTVKVEGKVVEKPSVDIGVIFQESRLFPWLTVEENIEFGIHEKMSKVNRKQLIREYISLVELNGFEKAFPRQLSGGMQQRVSITRALINKPDILLLDEPFGALDAFTRMNMQNEILRIWETEKKTMILVTHDIDEAIYLGDRVVVLSNRPGKIKTIIPVDLPRTRSRTSDDFMAIRKKVYLEFFENVAKSIEYFI